MVRAGDKDSPRSSSGRPARSASPRRKRLGLPDKSSIVSVRTLISPKGNRYRIIETNEVDAYENPAGYVPSGRAGKRKT